jgi:hypothetical protein
MMVERMAEIVWSDAASGRFDPQSGQVNNYIIISTAYKSAVLFCVEHLPG